MLTSLSKRWLLWSVCAALWGSRAQALELPSYDAAYAIRLARASSSYGPRAVEGTYDLRVEETCTGWETKSHIVLDLTFRDDLTSTNERFFSSWEANNESSYRFAVQTLKNGTTIEAFKGTASFSKKGGEASYEPLQGPGKPVTFTLPTGTLLPMAHTRAILQHAEHGDALFRSVVLNGASSSGPRVLSIVIGPRDDASHLGNPPSAPDSGIDSKLLPTPSWRLSSALFKLHEQGETPTTELSIDLHDTGIVQSFEQTYGDYSLSATLSRLRRLPQPACG